MDSTESHHYEVHLPPHAHFTDLRFDAEAATLHLGFGEEATRTVALAAVRYLHAAGVHHDEVGPGSVAPEGDEFAHVVLTPGHKDVYTPILAMRVEGVSDVLFTHLDALNYRHALGADAELTAKANVPKFLDRLAVRCTEAGRSPGYEAMRAGQRPPVAETLNQVLRATAG